MVNQHFLFKGCFDVPQPLCHTACISYWLSGTPFPANAGAGSNRERSVFKIKQSDSVASKKRPNVCTTPEEPDTAK